MVYSSCIRNCAIRLLVIIASFYGPGICDPRNDSSCLQAGFIPSSLQCSSCNELKQFSSKLSGSLRADCLRCCTRDGEESEDGTKTETFPFAELVMCQCKLPHYPQIDAFLKTRLSAFEGVVSFHHQRAAEPVIRLLNAQREVRRELGVEKWTTDQLDEFLREQLTSTSPSHTEF
jgi:hypothetical protein